MSLKPRDNEYTIQTAAKLIGIGEKKLFQLLRDEKILNQRNLPYQRYIDQNIFRVQEGTWIHPELGPQYYGRTFVTRPGLAWLERFVQRQTQAA